VQRPRLDPCKVSDESTQLPGVFDLAKEVVVGGVWLKDHGRALGGAVIHQEVDFVPVEGVFTSCLPHQNKGKLLLFVNSLELVKAIDDVFLKGIQVL